MEDTILSNNFPYHQNPVKDILFLDEMLLKILDLLIL